MYRVSPLALVYPSTIEGQRRFILQLKASEPPLILKDWRVVCALAVLPDRFSHQVAVDAWGELFGGKCADDLFEFLVAEHVIIKADANDPVATRFDAWKEFGWPEAASFQEATRDYPFVKMDEIDAFEIDRARMRAYVDQALPPPIYQTVESEFTVKLPPRLAPCASANACLAEMTESEKRGLHGLGLFFDVCFGERSKESFGVQGDFLRKAIPSGGARHPTEIFFLRRLMVLR